MLWSDEVQSLIHQAFINVCHHQPMVAISKEHTSAEMGFTPQTGNLTGENELVWGAMGSRHFRLHRQQ